MSIFGLLVALIVLALSVIISVAISQPFTGALVRLRANYLPKAVSLDNVLEDGAADAQYEDVVSGGSGNLGSGIDGIAGRGGGGGGGGGVRGVTPRAISGYFLRQQRSAAKIGPVVSGILAMMVRTHRLEGMPGIYKGAGPVACQLIVLGLYTMLLYQGDMMGTSGGGYRSAPSGPGHFGLLGNLVFMLLTSIVALPLNVITNRAIVHPRVLTFRSVRDNLRELLSYAEYNQPWRLYLVPGLLAAQGSHIVWVGFVTRIVRHIFVPTLGGLPPSKPAGPGDDTYSGPSSESDGASTFGLAVFLAWCVLSVVVLSPLECVIVRLSVQRPERQQPLHLAYARMSSSSATGPAPYNNQAQVAQATVDTALPPPTAQELPAYSDNTTAPGSASEPSDPAPRPSFAIEDEDDDDNEASGEPPKDVHESDPKPNEQTTTANGRPNSTAAVTANSSTPAAHRVLGGDATLPNRSGSAPTAGNWQRAGEEPTEPVIALRPCDEPLSAEDAARAESEGFGAPTVERYQGMIDCLNKLVDEEGIEALYRGAWVTLLGILAGNFG